MRDSRVAVDHNGSADPLRVVLVEDEDLYRDLLRGVLEQEPGLRVVGSFGDGASALAVAPALRPDVVVLDIELGHGPNGIQVGLQLREQLPRLGVVVLSQHADPHFVSALPRKAAMGGWSYLIKTSVRERTVIVRAILGAARGEVVLDPQVVAGGTPRAGSCLARLAPRQRAILQLVAQGLTNAAIAERLVLAEKSVENQLTTIYEHLGIERRDSSAHTRVQAVLAYLRESQWPLAPSLRDMGASPLTPGAPAGDAERMTNSSARPAASDADAKTAAEIRCSVFLVDDQPEFLRAARSLLGSDPRLVVVGQAGSAREALAILSDLAPDVVVLDVQMPGMNGFETAQALRAVAPSLRIILTSTVEAPVYSTTAARLGAAFLPKKQLSPQAVLDLVRDSGNAYLP